ncbi:hypothetical protein ACP4OV_017260 [Aristida adscensionis]
MPDPRSRARRTRQHHEEARPPFRACRVPVVSRRQLDTDYPLLPRLLCRIEEERPEERPHRASSPTSSEKLVASAFESAAVLAMQELHVSSSEELLDVTPSEELITDSRQTAPHNTTDGSSSAVPLKQEKLVTGAAEFLSAQTLQVSDVSSSKELLGTTSSLKELFTATPQTVPHNTTDGSPALASSLSSMEESLDTSSEESVTDSPRMVPHNTTDGSRPSGHCYSISSGPTIWVRTRRDWYFTFYIRMDRVGSFRVHPDDLDGPFQSLQEADNAINCYLDKLWSPAMYKEQDKVSPLEWVIQNSLFYLDGTRRRGPTSPASMDPHLRQRHFIQALLDQYNDDCDLYGDLAHELEGGVKFQVIYENHMRYYHFNFRTKTGKVDNGYCDGGNLFFAEVAQMLSDSDWWVVSCCCIIKDIDNGHCYGCRNNGNPGMKHPCNVDAYYGGHLDGYLPWGDILPSDSDEDDEALVDRLRSCYEGLDDPGVLEELFPPDGTTTVNA